MIQTSIFNNLILLSLICFGISGSLSHIFNLGLVLFLAWNYFNSKNEFLIEPSAKKLFLLLCSVFFIFIIRGVFHSDTWISLESLSPMLPIPIIGLAILYSTSDGSGINAQRLELNAKIAIVTTFLIYIIFSKKLAFDFGLTEYFLGRLEIFSGNPVPFSTAVFGVTVFCFCNWRHSTGSEKIISIACLLIGFWLAGIASGTRGTLLAIILSLPIAIWFFTQSISLILLIPAFAGLILWLMYINEVNLLGFDYIARINAGLETLLEKSNADYSVSLKMKMWSASLSAIKDNLFWGHDISNRFSAISGYLPETFPYNFSHPHNDVFACTIGAGLIGGIFSVASLLSPIWASFLSQHNTKEKFFLGILVTLGVVFTANLNTVFFNDVTAAWLAFSTFLIWNLNYSKNGREN